MANLIIQPQGSPLRGSVPVPADRQLAEVWACAAALAKGKSELSAETWLEPELWRAFGIDADRDDSGFRISGKGLWGLRAPAAKVVWPGTELGLGAWIGLLAGQRFATEVTMQAKPELVEALCAALNARGARLTPGITTQAGIAKTLVGTALPFPLRIGALNANQRLEGSEQRLPAFAAAVKVALLFSGLFADGPTELEQEFITADHAERTFDACNLPLTTLGPFTSLHPPADDTAIRPFSAAVPGDVGLGLVIAAAALIVPESQVQVRQVGLNASRLGLVDYWRQAGALIGTEVNGSALGDVHGLLTVIARSATAPALAGSELALDQVARMGPESVLAAVVAARSAGVTRLPAACFGQSLLSGLEQTLTQFGVATCASQDVLEIQGRSDALRAAELDPAGDAWLAMAQVLLALTGSGASRVSNADCLADVFPRFVGTLRALGASIAVEK